MTLEELRAAIRGRQVLPSDLFDTGDILQVPAVVEHVRKEKQTEYEHAKRVETKLGEERQARIDAEKKHEEQLTQLRQENVKLSTGTRIDSVITDRKIDGKRAAFIRRNLGQFKSEAKDDTDVRRDLDRFVDDQLKEFGEMAKLLGVEGSDDDKKTDNPNGAGGTNTDPDPKDLSDPKNNPLIPS